MKTLKNTLLITVSKVLSILTNLILGIILLRSYDLNFFGVFAFTIALTNLFISLAAWGFNQYSIREIAQHGRRKFRDSILLPCIQAKLILTVICMLCYFILYAFFLNNHIVVEEVYNHYLFVLIASFIIFFDSFKHFFNNSLYSLGLMQFETLSVIIEKIFLFSSVLLGVRLSNGIIYYILCLFFSKLIAGMFSFKYYKRYIGFQLTFNIDYSRIKILLKNTFPFFVQTLLTYLYFQTDIILLGLIISNEEVGMYQSSLSIVAAFLIIPWAFMNTIFPKISRRYKLKQFKKIKTNLKQIMIYSFLFTVPLAYIFFKNGRGTIELLYSEDALKSVFVFKVLIWLIIFRFQSYIIGYFLDSVNMEKDRAYIISYTVVINIILNLVLIPYYQSIGAAMATFLSDFILVILCLIKLFAFFKKVE